LVEDATPGLAGGAEDEVGAHGHKSTRPLGL